MIVRKLQPQTHFRSVRAALDASFDAICRNMGLTQKDAFDMIRRHLETMSKEWFSGKAPNIVYGDPLCRFAYLYCHTAVNANLCESAIRSSTSLCDFIESKIVKDQELRVCAFGGGPGTELLAICKHIIRSIDTESPARLSFLLLDRVAEWAETWTILEKAVNSWLKKRYGSIANWPFVIAKSFVPYDMTSIEGYGNVAQLLENDFYVMNYVVSELVGNQKGFQKTVSLMASAAPVGSKFLIVDRNQDNVVANAKALLAKAGLDVGRAMGTSSNCDSDEQISDLGPYVTQIGRKPRVQWNGAFWVVGTKT